MSLRRRALVLAATLLVGGFVHAFLGGCSRGEAEVGTAAEPPLKRVRVAQVAAATGERHLQLSGVLRAERRARLGFPAGGRLVARPVEVGDRVEAGALLARLEDDELRAAREDARGRRRELAARRTQSDTELRRVETLAKAKAATPEELERARADADVLVAAEEAAAARERAADRRWSDARLIAPFAATVTEVLFEPGEVPPAGAPVVALSGDGSLEVALEVPESALKSLEEGAEVSVELPALGAEVRPGRIRSVGRAAAGAGALFPVVVALEPAPTRAAAGMTAEVSLPLGASTALLLPVEAVVDPGGRNPAVFVLRNAPPDGPGDARVERLPVRVGTLGEGGVEITPAGPGSGSDLVAGDRVVVGGQRGLLDGETVLLESRPGDQP